MVKITPEGSQVVQYYNKLTLVSDKFDIFNYISSFKHSRYGLLLAYALLDLERYGVEFEIVSGYDSSDPKRDDFKFIAISIISDPENRTNKEFMSEMTDNGAKYYDHSINSDINEENIMYLVLN